MKKAIVKAKLTLVDDFVVTLNGIGLKFSEPYWQHDRIFVTQAYDREKAMPRISLRTVVRDDKTTYYLVLHRHFESNHLDVINETAVSDYAEAAHILYQLGYELKYEIARRREELIMNSTVRIYIDKVDSLPGTFVKIESNLDEQDDSMDAYQDLMETLNVLNVKSSAITPHSYGELIEQNSAQ